MKKKIPCKVKPLQTTLKDRGAIYGDFTDNAEIAQKLKTTLEEGGSWSQMSAAHKEALEVIMQKASRIVTGDPEYTDNWHDIQGYAKLAEDRCK